MSTIVMQSLWMYGLAAVVSMLIAAIIKAIVVLLGRFAHKSALATQPQPIAVANAVATDDPPAEHVAIIGAAVFAALGEHRIVHIEAAGRGDWAADGRHAHHTSHVLPGHPPRR